MNSEWLWALTFGLPLPKGEHSNVALATQRLRREVAKRRNLGVDEAFERPARVERERMSCASFME